MYYIRMKKLFTTILIILALVAPVVVALSPTPVMAATSDTPACFGIPFSVGRCVTEIAAWVGNLALMAASSLVFLAGSLLNFSIKLTLEIGELTANTKAVENTWIIIRNLSSIFIIFTLLYTSILTILDMGKANIKELVGKIILAGLLINFSLFFTKAAIDASNLISLQFYSAIAPEYMTSTDAGLSKIFMGSLRLQNLYHPDKSAIAIGSKDETDTFVSIMIATYGGTILMIFAAISFFAAAIAFSIRTAVLVLLMAFSPVYFVGMIFPELKKDVADKWLKLLTGQLIFMPVYLLLMYVAMTLITDPGFLSFIQSNKPAPPGGSLSFLYNQAGVVIQYFIAILFINAPLIAAVQLGAMGTKFAEGMTKGLKDNIFKQPGYLLKQTSSRAASKLAESQGFRDFAAKSQVGQWALQGTRGVAKNYNEQLEKQKKERLAFSESLGEDPNLARHKAVLAGQKAQLKAAKDRKADPKVISQLEANIAKINEDIKSVANRRQQAFANRINTRSVDTLWFKVARKDKEAANEIQNKIRKDEIENTKKKMESDKTNLNRLEAKLKASSKGGGKGEDLSTEEVAELDELRTNMSTNQQKITKLELEIIG